MPWNALFGVRYEHTDVESPSLQLVPTGLLWQDNNDFSVTPGTQTITLNGDTSYSNVLPSLDFDLALT